MRIRMGAEELVELGRSCGKGKILREAYTTKRGVHVPATCVKDVGAKGKTRASERWLPDMGPSPFGRWSKKLPDSVRHRSLLKKTEEKGCLRVLRDLNALANVTADKPTEKLLRKDFRWLRAQGACHLKTKRMGHGSGY